MSARSTRKRRSIDNTDALEEDEVEILDGDEVVEFHRLLGLGARGLAEERAKVSSELSARKGSTPTPLQAPLVTLVVVDHVVAPAKPSASNPDESNPQPNAPPTGAVTPPVDAVTKKEIEDVVRKEAQLMVLEAAFERSKLNTAPIRSRFASFRSENRRHVCKKCNLHFDMIVFITKAGDYSVLTAGSCFLQGDKKVEIVAFSHERDVRLMTASGDVLGPIIPLRSVLEAVEEAEQVAYDSFVVRQAQLLLQYEEGESQREREEYLKKVEIELRVASADLKSTKTELVTSRSREKTMKERLENAAEVEKERNELRTKNKKLTKENKELADKAKESTDAHSDLRKEIASLKRELELKRKEVDSVQMELEHASKRQRTSDRGDYRPSPSPQNNGFNLDHLNEKAPLKSLSMTW